ncbi:MAG TPA: CBS domain-containing protein [Candidatus Limnocylindria bacterium]|nr:CBS domain-containing protein [Candidatus Limnocylindria bacterium]
MKLEEFMIREVIRSSPSETIAEAAKRMREKAVGCLVATLDGAVKGIITDRDLLTCLAEAHDPYGCPVSAHMRRPVIVLGPEEDHVTAAKVLRSRKIKRLPVAKSGRLLGMISLSDLAALANEEAAKLQSSLDFLTEVVNAQAAQSSGLRLGQAGMPPVAEAQFVAPSDAEPDASDLTDAGGLG